MQSPWPQWSAAGQAARSRALSKVGWHWHSCCAAELELEMHQEQTAAGQPTTPPRTTRRAARQAAEQPGRAGSTSFDPTVRLIGMAHLPIIDGLHSRLPPGQLMPNCLPWCIALLGQLNSPPSPSSAGAQPAAGHCARRGLPPRREGGPPHPAAVLLRNWPRCTCAWLPSMLCCSQLCLHTSPPLPCTPSPPPLPFVRPWPCPLSQAHRLDDIPDHMPGLPVEEAALRAAEQDRAHARVREVGVVRAAAGVRCGQHAHGGRL